MLHRNIVSKNWKMYKNFQKVNIVYTIGLEKKIFLSLIFVSNSDFRIDSIYMIKYFLSVAVHQFINHIFENLGIASIQILYLFIKTLFD